MVNICKPASITHFLKSTFWFDILSAVFAFALRVSLALVVCTIWKVSLMKEEAKLIAKGKEAAA